MTAYAAESTLRNPEADALREALAKTADEISEVIGVRYVSHSVTDWVKLRESWRISYIWLLAPDGKALEPGQVAAENRGFRAIVENGQCTLEVWDRDGQVGLTRSGYIAPDKASNFLILSFARD